VDIDWPRGAVPLGSIEAGLVRGEALRRERTAQFDFQACRPAWVVDMQPRTDEGQDEDGDLDLDLVVHVLSAGR
jgi:hypothetical protein